MRFKTCVSLITVFVFLASGAGPVLPYTDLRPASGLSAQAAIPFTPGSLLDDFTGTAGVNKWGAVTYNISSEAGTPPSDAVCNISYANDSAVTYGSASNSIKLDYNVSRTGSFAGYLSNLGETSLSSYHYVSFWVKGAAGGEFFKITLSNNSSDPDRNKASVYITDYLQGGVTAAWQKVIIPMDAFANIIDRSSMKDIQFIFEQHNSSINGSPTSGTVYLDNISFGKQFLGYVKISPFSYRDTLVGGSKYVMANNSMGGQSNYTSWNGSDATAYTTSAQYNSSPYGMEFNFTNMWAGNNRWAAAYFIIGGGHDGWQEIQRNLSGYSRITFYAKGDTESVKGVRVELACSAGTYYRFLKTGITTTWSKISIPFSDIRSGDDNGDPSGTPIEPSGTYTIKKCAFVESYWLGYWGSIPTTGTLYIDNIQFEMPLYAPDTTPPAAPAAPTVSGSGQVFTVSTTASSSATDFTMENVRFEYSTDSATWYAVGYDYDTADGSYSAQWDTFGLNPRTYYVRAVAMDASGNIATSTQTNFVKPNSAAYVGEISPDSGSSAAGQYVIFTATYTDPDGPQNFFYTDFMTNTSTSMASALYCRYVPAINQLFIASDSGASWGGGLAPGSTGTVSNSQGTLNYYGTSVTRSGATVTIKWKVSYKSAFSGAKNTYLYTQDSASNTGIQQKGTWTIE